MSRLSYSYLKNKIEYSLLASYKKVETGQIATEKLPQQFLKSLFTESLTYHYLFKGEEMAPTIPGQLELLLIRKLPLVTRKTVFVRDVVVLKDPTDSDRYLVRRLAAVEGEEMVSNDEKDEPFVLEDDECWVLSDNETLKPKETKDSRTFGPVPMTSIVGRVLYGLQTGGNRNVVENSFLSLEKDASVIRPER